MAPEELGPRFETTAPPDIPLRIPAGTHHKPWLNQNAWLLALTAVAFGAFLLSALLASFWSDGKPRPGSPHVTFVVSGVDGLSLQPSVQKFKLSQFEKNVPKDIFFDLRNESDKPIDASILYVSRPRTVDLTWCILPTSTGQLMGQIPAKAGVVVRVRFVSTNLDSSHDDVRAILVSESAPSTSAQAVPRSGPINSTWSVWNP